MATRTLIEQGLVPIAEIDFLAGKIITGTPENNTFIVTTIAADLVTTIELFNSATILQNAPDTLTTDIQTLVDAALLTAYNTIKTGLGTLKTTAEAELAALTDPE